MTPEQESGGESPENESGQDAEMSLPKDIDEEYYNNLIQKAQAIVKNFQTKEDFEKAEEVQTMLLLCNRLRREIMANKIEMENIKSESNAANEKLFEAIRVSHVDQHVITQLKESVETAWRQTDAAQEREQVAQEQLYILRQKVEHLEVEVQKMTEKKEMADDVGSGLTKHKESILKERDRLNAEVEELKRRLHIQRSYTDEIEKKRIESEYKNKELYKMLDETSSEAFKDKRLLDSVRAQLNETTLDLNAKIEEIKTLRMQTEVHVKSSIQHNLQLLATKSNLDRVNTQFNIISNKFTKAVTDLELLSQHKEKIQFELTNKTNLLKLKEEEIVKYRHENNKLVKIRESLMKKLQVAELSKYNIEQDMIKLKNELLTQEKQNDINYKTIEKVNTKMENVIRERDLIKKELVRINRTINERNNNIFVQQQEIKTLQVEIKSHQQNEQKQKAVITRTEMERDRNAEEIHLLEDRLEALQDELHLKDNYTAELKNNINEIQTKLVQMQSLFETARTERNNFQRSLQTCMEERNDLKMKLVVAVRQAEQMKEEISNKDAEVVRSQKNLDKLERDRQQLKVEIHNMEVVLQNTRSELKEKKLENDRLYKTLSDDEIRLAKLKKQFDTALNEKDLIGSQIVRRNDEIALLNEKVEMLQMALDRGEIQYAKRLEDIRLLKIEISNLQSQRNMLTRGLSNTADMRQEVLQLHRVLNQERIKARALEDEMLTPMNVHRWRTLSGKDPEKMDLIFKVHILQKRILSQTVTATNRENDLREAHKLYLALKQFMLTLPSYKVKEQLNETQRTLVIRNKKLKALMAELNTKEIDDKAKECTVDELRKNLESAKKDLVREKKKKQRLLQEREVIFQMQQVYSAPPTYNKTMGSGFKVTLSS